MPDTYEDGIGYDLGTKAGHSGIGISKVSAVTTVIDFAKIKKARAATNPVANALVVGDALKVIRIPANSILLSVAWRVAKAETENATAEVAIGYTGSVVADDSNAYRVSAAVATADKAGTTGASTAAGLAASGPTYFLGGNGTVTLTIAEAVPEDAVIEVTAVIVNAKNANSA